MSDIIIVRHGQGGQQSVPIGGTGSLFGADKIYGVFREFQDLIVIKIKLNLTKLKLKWYYLIKLRQYNRSYAVNYKQGLPT